MKNIYFPNKHKLAAELRSRFKESLPFWWRILKKIAIKLRIPEVVRKIEADFESAFLLENESMDSWAEIPPAKDININKSVDILLEQLYFGYEYLAVVDRHPAQLCSMSKKEVTYEIVNWCIANARGEFRADVIDVTTVNNQYYTANGVANADIQVLCIAFKNLEDYGWYELKWS